MEEQKMVPSVALEQLCFPTNEWEEGCCFFFFQFLQRHKMKKKAFSLPKKTLTLSCSQSLLLLASNTISFKTFSFLALINTRLLSLPNKENHCGKPQFILSSCTQKHSHTTLQHLRKSPGLLEN